MTPGILFCKAEATTAELRRGANVTIPVVPAGVVELPVEFLAVFELAVAPLLLVCSTETEVAGDVDVELPAEVATVPNTPNEPAHADGDSVADVVAGVVCGFPDWEVMAKPARKRTTPRMLIRSNCLRD